MKNEEKIYDLYGYVADKHKDLQLYSESLKNPEDVSKNLMTYSKIKDAVADAIRAYGEISELEEEE